MIKIIKKIIFSAVSVLGVSFLFWMIFLLNPNLSYANKTQFSNVTVYHNGILNQQTEKILNDALGIIKKSELFDENVAIQLCLNDDEIYPNLHPFAGAMAYAMFNKTVIKNCEANFEENLAKAKWEINNYELRTFNLTWLLAHEFTHNLQYRAKPIYVLKSTIGILNWKLEGHAEYISRAFKSDGKLKVRIAKYLQEEKQEHNGLPVFELEDGTKQILPYFKNALVIQYLMEEKEMNFEAICEIDSNLDSLYAEMLEWYEK